MQQHNYCIAISNLYVDVIKKCTFIVTLQVLGAQLFIMLHVVEMHNVVKYVLNKNTLNLNMPLTFMVK